MESGHRVAAMRADSRERPSNIAGCGRRDNFGWTETLIEPTLVGSPLDEAFGCSDEVPDQPRQRVGPTTPKPFSWLRSIRPKQLETRRRHRHRGARHCVVRPVGLGSGQAAARGQVYARIAAPRADSSMWGPFRRQSPRGEPPGAAAVASRRRWLLGTALDIMRPGAGARDPGMVSLSVFIVVMPLC